MPTKDACSVGPDARDNLIRHDLHSTPQPRLQETERHMASRSLRRSVFPGRLTAARPYREMQRGLVAAPTLSDYLLPAMDSLNCLCKDINYSHALLSSLLACTSDELSEVLRSLRKRNPRYRLVEVFIISVLFAISAGVNALLLFFERNLIIYSKFVTSLRSSLLSPISISY